MSLAVLKKRVQRLANSTLKHRLTLAQVRRKTAKAGLNMAEIWERSDDIDVQPLEAFIQMIDDVQDETQDHGLGVADVIKHHAETLGLIESFSNGVQIDAPLNPPSK